MPFQVGDIIIGHISGITKFGAFVSLEEGKNGLIHISEISKNYVEKVEDYVKKGDEVKVKVLTIGNDGKISLSLRQAQVPKTENLKAKQHLPVEKMEWMQKKEVKSSFEDKLEKFLKESNERYDQIRSREGKKTGHRY